jgi:hypothetical protein
LVRYSLSANENQHEGRRVGRDAGIDVAGVFRVERQRTAVKDHDRAQASAQAQFNAGAKSAGLLLFTKAVGQRRDQRPHEGLHREQCLVALYRPRLPGDCGDVVAVVEAFSQQASGCSSPPRPAKTVKHSTLSPGNVHLRDQQKPLTTPLST